MADGSLHPPEPDEGLQPASQRLPDPIADRDALVRLAGQAIGDGQRNAMVRMLVIIWRSLSYRDRSDFLGGVNTAGDLEFDVSEAKRMKKWAEDARLRNRLELVAGLEGETAKIARSITSGRGALTEKQVAFALRCIREGKMLDVRVTE